MTIGELRALPVGRGHIGEIRYLPVGKSGAGRGRGASTTKGLQAGRDVPVNILKLGVKLPIPVESTSMGPSNSAVRDELESIKPDLSLNPWLVQEKKRKQVKDGESYIEEDGVTRDEEECSQVGAPNRESLKKELDEVLKGIREMGGVSAIFREGESPNSEGDSSSRNAEEEDEEEHERNRSRKLWMIQTEKGNGEEIEDKTATKSLDQSTHKIDEEDEDDLQSDLKDDDDIDSSLKEDDLDDEPDSQAASDEQEPDVSSNGTKTPETEPDVQPLEPQPQPEDIPKEEDASTEDGEMQDEVEMTQL